MLSVNLGQFFTPSYIADFMVSLLKNTKSGSFLDPCFGKGVFIKSLYKKGIKDITGIEIDEKLFNSDFNFNFAKMNCDFLNHHFVNQYDGIVMNPPYVRQEEINNLAEYGITKTSLLSKPIFSKISRKSNLYCYFIVKACSLLKEHGLLVAIFPSTWLSTNNNLLNVINDMGCCIKERYNCEGFAFGSDVLVDADIVVFGKGKVNTNTLLKCSLRNNQIVVSGAKTNTKLIEENHIPLSKITRVKRGFTSGYNDFFFKDFNNNNFKLQKCISNPRKVESFVTDSKSYDDFLIVTKSMAESEEMQDYIKKHEKIVLDAKIPLVIYNKILKKEKWYLNKPELTRKDSLVFSYIIRNKMKFVLLSKDSFVRDNFYIFYPLCPCYLLFALLNNFYTYYRLELVGKKYGGGLLKLQTYDFKKLNVLDPTIIKKEDLYLLNSYFVRLKNKEIRFDEYIQTIGFVLERYESQKYNEIEFLLKNIKKERLGTYEK